MNVVPHHGRRNVYRYIYVFPGDFSTGIRSHVKSPTQLLDTIGLIARFVQSMTEVRVEKMSPSAMIGGLNLNEPT